MIVALENKAERVHLLMAAPALGGIGCFLEAIAKGGVLDFGNPGIDTNRHVRHRSAE